MSLRIDDEKLSKKYKAIWTNTEDLKKILNALLVYDDRYIKTKIRSYGNEVYTNFRGLSVREDDIECESSTVVSIDSLLVNDNKYYLQAYLENCAYKIVSKQVTDYLDGNLFEYYIIDQSEGIDLAKTNKSKECMIRHYWFFNHGFKFQDPVCSGRSVFTILSVNISDIVIITLKNVDYNCIIHNIMKFAAIDLLGNSVLENCRYI